MEFGVLIFWVFLGLAKISCGYSIRLVELAWKAFVWHLEFNSIMLDVVSLEGAK